MVVITGKNERLYEMFKEKAVPHSKKSTKLIYFTDEVESYMHASDLLVTKPGGLTVSEALACGIPLAVFDAIPGQEEDNTDFLLNHNMAVELGSGKDCAAIISDLLSNEEELKKMRASCEEFDKTDSKKQIFSLMEDLMKVYHTGPYAAVPSPQERLKSLNNPT
jgi:processive 1,2-diacylglycerol beta-glucosyltransferase